MPQSALPQSERLIQPRALPQEATLRSLNQKWAVIAHSAQSIAPKGLRPSAQGCGSAATLGLRHDKPFNQPQRGCVRGGRLGGGGRNPIGVGGYARAFSQGSGQPATVGWRMESRWDSGRSPHQCQPPSSSPSISCSRNCPPPNNSPASCGPKWGKENERRA
jgi:hypothetical protein